MAGPELILLKQEINHYLGIPYWSNKIIDNKIYLNGPFGGKGSWRQIQKITEILLKKANIDPQTVTAKQVYCLQKKHRLGIDCSGLVYHLLNYWYKIHFHKSIKRHLHGTNNKFGPRRINVASLSSNKNSIRLKNINLAKTGDLIIMDKKRHVLFVVESKNDHIVYVHSSRRTKITGVHYGKILLTNPGKTLDYQTYSDKTKNGIDYHRLIFINHGDGLYRIRPLTQI